MICPDCGASNPKGAAWCNLCARPFTGSVATDRAPEPIRPEPSPSGDETGAPEAPGDATWTCPTCGETHPLEVDVCSVCGTSIFDAFGRREEVTDRRSEAVARMWVPGWAHIALGDQPTGAMLAAVILVGAVIGLLLVLAPGTVWAGVACLLLATGTWVAGVVDVRRRLAGTMSFLTPQRLLFAALAIVVVALVAILGVVDG